MLTLLKVRHSDSSPFMSVLPGASLRGGPASSWPSFSDLSRCLSRCWSPSAASSSPNNRRRTLRGPGSALRSVGCRSLLYPRQNLHHAGRWLRRWPEQTPGGRTTSTAGACSRWRRSDAASLLEQRLLSSSERRSPWPEPGTCCNCGPSQTQSHTCNSPRWFKQPTMTTSSHFPLLFFSKMNLARRFPKLRLFRSKFLKAQPTSATHNH